MTVHTSTGDIIYYLSEAADDETLAWLSDNSGLLRAAVRHAEIMRDTAELRQRTEAAERDALSAQGDATRASDERQALSREATRLAGVLAIARQTNATLKAQIHSTPDTTRGAPAAAFSASDIRDIHAALSPSATDAGVRTKGIQAINAFIDRMDGRRNPATVPSVAELNQEASRLQSRIEDAEYIAKSSRRAAGEARSGMSSTQARVDEARTQIAAVERSNEELREAIRGKVEDTPGGMSKESIKALRLALHPDRKPKLEELQNALRLFDAYVSKTGNTTSDADRDRRQREQEAREWTERKERAESAARAARDRQYAEERAARDRQYEREAGRDIARSLPAIREMLIRLKAGDRVVISYGERGRMATSNRTIGMGWEGVKLESPGSFPYPIVLLEPTRAGGEVGMIRSINARSATWQSSVDQTNHPTVDALELLTTGERQKEQTGRAGDDRPPGGVSEEQHYLNRVAERLRLGNFKVGDILYCEWGSTMTVVNFYEVVYAKGKSIVTLMPIGARTVSGSAGYQGEVVPIPGASAGAEIVKRPQVRGGSIYVKINDIQRCYLWDGKPKPFDRRD